MTFSFADFPTITVHARASYPSWKPQEHEWRGQDYDANFFTKAIKADREKMGQRAKSLPIGPNGSAVRVAATSFHLAQTAFAGWAAAKLRELRLEQVILLPIPNSSGTVDAVDFNTASIARMIAEASGGTASAHAVLRFLEYRPKSERERRPSAQELRENMVLINAIPDGTIVLIDDVFTLGHHITAASWMIPGERRADHAIVASRTIKHPAQDAWAPITETHLPF